MTDSSNEGTLGGYGLLDGDWTRPSDSSPHRLFAPDRCQGSNVFPLVLSGRVPMRGEHEFAR
jgi:hypothetical protein